MITTIGKLFDFVYGQKEYHSKEWLEGTEGKNILISSKGEDNGIYGFFDIQPKFKAPVITVQGYGTIGHAFVQEYDCAVDDHMIILIPKKKLNIETLFSIAYQIRLTKWKYRYGRGITPDRLRDEKIRIVKSKIKYKNLNKTLTPKSVKKQIISRGKIKIVPITELCYINREYYYYVEEVDRSKEIVPYITTTEYANGVGAFCNEDPIFNANSLTVSLDGKSGLTFYQTNKFIAGEKTAVLTPKENINKSFLIYIGAIIRLYSWRYNYCRKLSVSRLKKIKIPMPISANGTYDTSYINTLFKNMYGYEKIKSYLN